MTLFKCFINKGKNVALKFKVIFRVKVIRG